jgi:tRNA modification GTPase
MMDTIFALATAQGRAGVAIVRISGPLAVSATANFCDVPKKRGVRELSSSEGVVLDEALVLRFASGQSFTGEEVVELHLHGSIAVVAAVLRALGDVHGLRHAEAGEFTRRALENGKLDLAQVEGLADLIDAETESQRRQALRVLSGDLGKKADGWRVKLIRAAALIEATIDFADEEVPVDVSPEVLDLMAAVRAEMDAESRGVLIAERIRSGFEVAILGAPNVGKSTLLNRLAGREAAITSDIAGTTRDVIEVRMDLRGLAVTFLDTAGLRKTTDPVERIGVERAHERAKAADLRIYMLEHDELPQLDLGDEDIIVRAKSDTNAADGFGVSGITGAGVDELIHKVSSILASRAGQAGVAMRERHRFAMTRAVEYLDVASAELNDPDAMTDLIAEELRSAVSAVDSLIGRVDVEHVLDEIFLSFCIGK